MFSYISTFLYNLKKKTYLVQTELSPCIKKGQGNKIVIMPLIMF